MNQLPHCWPFTGADIVVTRFYCPDVDVTVEGRFAVNVPFAQLSPEQLHFIEVFVRNEGKLNRMEAELNLSYPTIRSRLHDVIRALGYEPGKEESVPVDEDDRKRILDDLDAGRIDFDEAMQMLGGA